MGMVAAKFNDSKEGAVQEDKCKKGKEIKVKCL